jgi:hypothetical protein
LLDQVRGKTEPRLWTPPLRELNEHTSYGYEVIEFAKSLGRPLDPWQEWLVIHIGELLEDGRPRFRKCLVLVSRQNGKTTLLAILALYWLFKAPAEQDINLVGGLSTNLGVAKEAWQTAINMALDAGLEFDLRQAAGEESLTVGRKRYRIAASNRRGFRGFTLDRLIVDELREHDSWLAMDAAEPTLDARRFGQQFMISNQGDDSSVVLDSYRKEALSFIETGEPDDRLGLFEWSAPDGFPEDEDQLKEALAQANPNLGYRLDLDDLLRKAKAAKAEGGQRLAGFRTENMCQRVLLLDPAIDPDGWARCAVPGTLDALRDRVALCLDVSVDGRHATLVAAAMDGSKARVEVVKAWDGPATTNELRRDLPGLVKQVNARVFGWFPNGGAAAVAADINFPGDRTKIEPIKGDVTQACMGFSDLVTGENILHSDDPLLNMQVNSAERMWQGDSWRFIRRGASSVDAVYACAGAVHLARTLPPPKPPLVIKTI